MAYRMFPYRRLNTFGLISEDIKEFSHIRYNRFRPNLIRMSYRTHTIGSHNEMDFLDCGHHRRDTDLEKVCVVKV